MNIRLDPAHKLLIERAAASLGVTPTDFVIAELVRGAQRALDECSVTRLNADESAVFVELLASPPKPVAALREAARRYVPRRTAGTRDIGGASDAPRGGTPRRKARRG